LGAPLAFSAVLGASCSPAAAAKRTADDSIPSSTKAAASVQEAETKRIVSNPTRVNPLLLLENITIALLSRFEPIGSHSFFYLMIPLFPAGKVTKKKQFVLTFLGKA
jgi:hypothetical protein